MLDEQYAVMVTSVILALKLRISGKCHSSDPVYKETTPKKKMLIIDVGMQLVDRFTDKASDLLETCDSYRHRAR